MSLAMRPAPVCSHYDTPVGSMWRGVEREVGVDRPDYLEGEVRALVERLFDGDPAALAAFLAARMSGDALRSSG